jgi:antitoxin component of RelBE/YafQ-DinJ toxin-antitoxin module
MKKDSQIQFRITSATKERFKTLLLESGKNMSNVINSAINTIVQDLSSNGIYTQLCINENVAQPTTINNDHIDFITNLDYTPTLKSLLKELMKVRYEEYACISDDCLLELYTELYQSNQLHLLFERQHQENRIKNEWSGDA